jgi:hypothetical protein
MTVFEQFRRPGPIGRRPLRVAAWVVSSMLAALVGPFGTFNAMTFDERLLYWGGLIGVAIVLALVIRRVALAYMGDTLGADIAGSVAISVTLGPAICAFNALALGHDVLSLRMMLHHMVVVFTVSLGIVLIRLYARILSMPEASAASAPVVVRSETLIEAAPDSASACPPAKDLGHDLPAFLKHVEEELGHNLRWITADDHYLWVHAEHGSARVLMRFRDALKDLSHLPGLQVHRSHWVAIPAVVEVRPDGRRHVAVLCCGAEVPVSRAYLPDLRAAGLMPDDAA